MRREEGNRTDQRGLAGEAVDLSAGAAKQNSRDCWLKLEQFIFPSSRGQKWKIKAEALFLACRGPSARCALTWPFLSA